MLNLFRRKPAPVERIEPLPPSMLFGGDEPEFPMADFDAALDQMVEQTAGPAVVEAEPEPAPAPAVPAAPVAPVVRARLEKPARVRLALPADESALYALLVALHHANPMGSGYNPAMVLEQIRMGTEQRGGIIGVIDGPDGTLVASVGLFPYHPWYVDQWALNELWLFVRPEARHGAALYRDLFRFMQWVRQENPSMEILTNVVSRDRLPLKERIWARFAERIGAIYLVKGA